MADQAIDAKEPTVVAQEPTPTEPSAVENNVTPSVDAGDSATPAESDDLMDIWNDDESAPKPQDSKPKDGEAATDKPADKPQEEPAGEQPTNKQPEGEPADKPEDQPRGKQDAESRIRQLANENRELRERISEGNKSTYRTNTVEELVEQGMSQDEARIKILEQGNELQAYERQVTDLNVQFDAEANQVLDDFPMFNPESQEYIPEVAEAARALYEEAADLQTDENTGFYTQVKVYPHKFYKTIADAYQKGMESGKADGQVSGQVAAEQMLASVDAPTSVTPTPAKKDDIAELWSGDD